MKLIFLSRRGRQSLTFDSHRWRDAAALLSLALLPLLLGVLGHSLYTALQQRGDEFAMLTEWHQALSQQDDEIAVTRAHAQRELAALTVRAAELQARVLRLDALGEQLAGSAGLDQGEFDFSRQPALGGPMPSVGDPAAGLAQVVAGSVPVDSAVAPTNTLSRLSLLQILDQLTQHIEDREQQLLLLEQQLAVRELRSDAFVAGKPVKKGWMSSVFGRRTDPFNGRAAWHEGVDFAGSAGADVIAVAAGVVTVSARKSGYGNLVEINHGDGFVTRYGHNDEHRVAVGDIVSRGQVIATMGNTGRSTGPHVHFEVLRQGKPVDPERYIYRAGL